MKFAVHVLQERRKVLMQEQEKDARQKGGLEQQVSALALQIYDRTAVINEVDVAIGRLTSEPNTGS